MKWIGGLIALFVLASCDPTGTEPKVKVVDQPKIEGEKISKLDQNLQVRDTLKMNNGITIRWFKHGAGEGLVRGSVYFLDFKVMLDNGDVIDGNHLLKKDSFPFPMGFQMQGKGWDLALAQLKLGDYVEIFLPSKWARGDKEIKGLIPANSNNTIKLRVLNKMKPTRVVDGSKVWVFEENKENKLLFDDEEKITFHTMISTPSKPRYVNTFAKNQPFELKLEDYGTVPGLKKALINAKSSDRMLIYVPSREAYGNKGYLDVVKPNEDLLFNVMVMDVVKK